MNNIVATCALSFLLISTAAFCQVTPVNINPRMAYTTYFGGSADESRPDIALERGSAGLWVMGDTYSTNIPIVDAFQPKSQGSMDVYLTRWSGRGDALLYSSYLGGSSMDIAEGGLLLDDEGQIYIAGSTYSTNFPVGVGGYMTNNPSTGKASGFLIKLSKDGSQVLAGTYFGGSDFDRIQGAAMDADTNIYITGYTASTNIPVLNGAQTNNMGEWDGFVTVFDSSFSNMLMSSYLGGESYDIPQSVAVNPGSRDILIGGYTQSTNFPRTNDFIHPDFDFKTGFLSVFSSTGSNLLYSSYLGGSNDSYVSSATFYTNNGILASGYTASRDFPLTNSFQDTYGTGAEGNNEYDGFVTLFDSTYTQLLYSSYLGGSEDDKIYGMTVDDRGRIIVSGATSSTNFPITANAFQSEKAQAPDLYYKDGFITVFTPIPTNTAFSTYLGGRDHDYAYSVAMDRYGAMYSGFLCYDGTDWPTNNGLYPNSAGDHETAIAKFVAPFMQFRGAALTNDALELTWFTDSHESAALDYSDDLRGSSWAPDGALTNMPCTTDTMETTTSVSATQHRVFRLRPIP